VGDAEAPDSSHLLIFDEGISLKIEESPGYQTRGTLSLQKTMEVKRCSVDECRQIRNLASRKAVKRSV